KIFEFEKYKTIIEQFLSAPLTISKASIESKYIDKTLDEVKPYILLFPSAGEQFNRWSPKNFAEIADFVAQKILPNASIIISGTPNDTQIANEVIQNCSVAKPINNCGKYNLVEIVSLIASASLVIS